MHHDDAHQHVDGDHECRHPGEEAENECNASTELRHQREASPSSPARIVLTMIWRANVVVPSVIATLLVALAWTHSPVAALASVFNASFTAAKGALQHFPGDRVDDDGAAERIERCARTSTWSNVP